MAAPAALAGAAKAEVIAKAAKIGVGVAVGGIVFFVAFAMSFTEMAKASCGSSAADAGFSAPIGLPAGDTARGTFGDPDSTELERFMFAKRQLESGQDYTIRSQYSTASGAYQYIDSTWNAAAHKAIWSKYGNFPRAYMAPPRVQDEVARYDFVAAWRTYGNWAQVAMSHYLPSWTDDPSKWDAVPPGAGNTLTLRQYAQRVLQVMNHPGDFPGGTDASAAECRAQFASDYVGDGTAGSMAVATASKYIGIGYKYGGGHAVGSQYIGMDCSGFVFNAYRDLGIPIGMWTGAQINNGVSVGTSLASAKPGDLIIVGSSRSDTRHVLMYHSYSNGQHLVLESQGAGSDCTADNPTYNSNPRCRGIGPAHPYADSRTIIDIRRIACSVDASGHPVACGAAAV